MLNSVQSNGSYYSEGQYSRWHQDLYDFYARTAFTSEAEALASCAKLGEPHPISFEGTVVNFGWKIEKESVEHREKWSQGHGYYLGVSKYSGWQVNKKRLRWCHGDDLSIEQGPSLWK